MPGRSTLLVGYLVLVLGSLPFTRDVLISLKALHLLSTTVTLLYLGAGAAVVYHVVFDVRLSDVSAFLALVLLAAVAGGLIVGLEIQEERVHFLQYALMVWLARSAFAPRFTPRAAYLAALGLTVFVGVLDELIQGALPSRVFDVRDIVTNVEAALLGAVADEVLHNRLGWRRST